MAQVLDLAHDLTLAEPREHGAQLNPRHILGLMCLEENRATRVDNPALRIQLGDVTQLVLL